MKKIRN